MPTVEELLDRAERDISKSKNVDLWRPSDARVNAEELISEVIGKEVTSDDLDDEVSAAMAARFLKFVARRVGGEPVALILGYIDFKGMRLEVEKGVFVPRNSSELLADKAVKRIRSRKAPVAVDVATGIGPVAMAIAKTLPKATVYGVDIWAPSLKVATRNARKLALKNVRFIESDMLGKLPKSVRGKVDAFTIHPPYVAKSEVRSLPKEIKDFEPAVSLTDNSNDGLGLVRLLAEQAPDWLSKGGWVMVEVSPNLARSVKSILSRAGFSDTKSERDSLGATRVISGRI